MPISLKTLLTSLSSIFHPRAALQLENLALRHQIGVLQRSFTAGRWVASPLRTTGCLKSQSLPGCEPPPLRVLKSVSGLCSLAHACIVEFHSLDSGSAAIC